MGLLTSCFSKNPLLTKMFSLFQALRLWAGKLKKNIASKEKLIGLDRKNEGLTSNFNLFIGFVCAEGCDWPEWLLQF